MNPENNPGHPGPSEIPSLDALRQQALSHQEAVPETAPDEQLTPEVSALAEASDPVMQLTNATAEIRELNRALALDYVALYPPATNPSEQIEQPSRIHSVQVSGHRAPRRNTQARLETLQSAHLQRAEAAKERPNWEEHFPSAEDPPSQQRYEAWLGQYPVSMQANIEALRVARSQEARLLSDPNVSATWEQLGAEKQQVFQSAAAIRIVERRQSEVARDIIDMKSAARRHGRELTTAERDYAAKLGEAVATMHQEVAPYLNSREVVEELRRRDAIEDSQQLKNGLLETEQMHRVIELTVPSLAEGKPLLLFGETGGAKTALALHMAREYFNTEPELVSGHAEVNAYQVMGKTGLQASGEGTETVFNPGPMYTAMAEGKPVILDEIDAMPSSFLIRLNYLLQLRPGDKLRIQEDSNHEITVKEGFCIIATANIKSARYQREEMDPAFLQRFRYGAGIEHIPYPDHDASEGQFPRENWRLATAFLTDAKGDVTLPPGLDIPDLRNLLSAAHTSQRMFTEPAAVVGANYVDSQRITQGRPALEKAVLAPREWMGILSQVRSTDGALSLKEALTRFVSGQTSPSDREVMAKLLATHNLLDGAPEEDLRITPGSLQGFRSEPSRNS